MRNNAQCDTISHQLIQNVISHQSGPQLSSQLSAPVLVLVALALDLESRNSGSNSAMYIGKQRSHTQGHCRGRGHQRSEPRASLCPQVPFAVCARCFELSSQACSCFALCCLLVSGVLCHQHRHHNGQRRPRRRWSSWTAQLQLLPSA
jgi:hypothetical protein